ncbi:transcriptional regulator [Gulosibacter molinativorax]|uniref:Transcriptional regulator n=2 Tax=Gulosibacter molinativorax TaxID=256821 RepID=A0ABT7C936_9MICO|nr:transcriptional regulator [Gulosibacter molinativorax]
MTSVPETRSPSRRTAGGRRHSPTRERLLREVETRGNATTAELVAATGLHENTVRGHLERLVADGHIRREQSPHGRGRPAVRWCALDAQNASPYAGLATTLAETLLRTASEPVREARRSGVQWGERLAADRCDPATKGADPRGLVLEVMREQGFAPVDEGDTAPPEADTASIALRACPLLTAAAQHADVICAVHEGMIEGIARTRDASVSAELEPFAADGVCILRLRGTGRPAA